MISKLFIVFFLIISLKSMAQSENILSVFYGFGQKHKIKNLTFF